MRYHHLDALRGILMLMGVFVHASTLGSSKIYYTIGDVSGMFRMQAFFLIAGFFNALLLSRYDATTVLRKRLVSLAVPLATVLVALNPMTNYLVHCYHNGPISPAAYFLASVAGADGPMVWHLHLWFLFSLVAYALVAPLIYRSIARFEGAAGALDAPASQSFWHGFTAFSLLAVAVASSSLSGRIVYELVVKARMPDFMDFIAKRTLTHFGFFVVGMVVYQRRQWLQVIGKLRPVHIVLAVALAYLVVASRGSMPGSVYSAVVTCSSAYLALCVVNLLWVGFAAFFSKSRPVMRFLSDASYTVYLLHYFVLYVVATCVRPVLGDGLVLLTTAAAATFLVTLSFHAWVVDRSGLLRLLLNGRPGGVPRTLSVTSATPTG